VAANWPAVISDWMGKLIATGSGLLCSQVARTHRLARVCCASLSKSSPAAQQPIARRLADRIAQDRRGRRISDGQPDHEPVEQEIPGGRRRRVLPGTRRVYDVEQRAAFSKAAGHESGAQGVE
jgi:hypothetical protein